MRPATQEHDDATTVNGLNEFGPEVAALLDAARDLASTLELPRLLELLLDHLNALVGYAGTAILVLEGDELVFAGMRNPDSFTWDEARQIRYPVAGLGSVWSRLCAGEPVIVSDVYAEYSEAQIFRSMVGEQTLRSSLAFIRSCMWVPLVLRDHLIGLLSITCPEPDGYTPRHAQLSLAIARQAAVGIENARLHARARQTTRHLEERTRELEALYRADATLYRSLRVEDVLQALVEEATELLGADKATVLVWDAAHEHLVPGAAHGFLQETVSRMRHRLGEGITGEVARTGRPIAVEDARSDPRVVRHIIDPEQIHSLLHVPITVNGDVFGVFGVNYCRPRQFSGNEQRLLGALAQRAALAIDNARLYARSEQRSREVEGLYRADEALHASLKLDEVLQALVDVATDLLDADKTAVMIWDATHEHLVARAGRGFSPATLERMVHGPGEGVTWRVAETGLPIVVNDVRQDPRVARHLSDPEGIRSFLQVPITIGDEAFGVFGVNHCQLHTFTEDEQRVLLALAQRAALAIRNARLYERAQQAAVLEERQRLTRELHDSVTQSLYGVALYTEAASRALGEGEFGPAAANLQDIRETTQEALGEMRLLLYELRPPDLEEHGLARALRARLQSVETRAGLDVAFECHGDERLPVHQEQELFRVAQEALSNVVKHAHATRVRVRLEIASDPTILEVCDNGAGFEPSLLNGAGFGLRGMRERVEHLGGSLKVASAPGEGTRVWVEVPR
jgi:signal transduction histidine kinase